MEIKVKTQKSPVGGSFPETLRVYLLAVVFGASGEGKQIWSRGGGGGGGRAIHTTSKCLLVLSEGPGGLGGPRWPLGTLAAPP